MIAIGFRVCGSCQEDATGRSPDPEAGCRLVLDATGDGAANPIANRDSAQRWTPTGDACASPVDLIGA
jgi:hypothetical protein